MDWQRGLEGQCHGGPWALYGIIAAMAALSAMGGALYGFIAAMATLCGFITAIGALIVALSLPWEEPFTALSLLMAMEAIYGFSLL